MEDQFKVGQLLLMADYNSNGNILGMITAIHEGNEGQDVDPVYSVEWMLTENHKHLYFFNKTPTSHLHVKTYRMWLLQYMSSKRL